VPLHYTWSKREKQWVKRKRGEALKVCCPLKHMLSQTIVRIYAVRPRYLERFAIRLLAMTVPGPQSFEDL